MSRSIAGSVSATLPAPVEGWDTREALADMPEKRAVILDNWFPSTDKVNIRPGYASHATGLGGAVETLIEYTPNTGFSSLWAIAGGSIFNVTSAGAVGAAAVSGLTNSRWQYVNFGTAGGQFVVAVNGADAPRIYNGTTWATTPAITGPTAANLVWINAHQRRLWVGERDSLTAWYGPVNTLGGAFSSFSFAGLAKRGGYIMAMGTWSRDGGDGQDDVAAWITSEGECLVYQGTDPATAGAWTLVGVFQLGKPIGRRCMIKAGADLLIVTEEGVVPLSTILSTDRSQTERVALTQQVNRAFNQYVRDYGSLFGWEPLIYPRRTMLLFNIPTSSTTADQIVFNTITRAPCRFTGIPALTWAMRGNDAYFGASNGIVYRFDNNATSDAGTNINTDALQAFSYFRTPGVNKAFKLARPVFESNTAPAIAVELNTDFEVVPTASVTTTLASAAGVWDAGLWDVATWGGAADIYNGWIGVRGIGRAAALRMRTASTVLVSGWISTDFTYVPGGQL
ncbi:MAG: hypothetical protein ING29_11365 [Azospirillum sp.]|nr:hypothetical protein [Azospirillum sp.]